MLVAHVAVAEVVTELDIARYRFTEPAQTIDQSAARIVDIAFARALNDQQLKDRIPLDCELGCRHGGDNRRNFGRRRAPKGGLQSRALFGTD